MKITLYNVATALFAGLLTSCCLCNAENKYTEEVNKQAKLFRSLVLNRLWDKVNTRGLPQAQIQDLRTWLFEIDDVYMEVKHSKEGQAMDDHLSKLNTQLEKIFATMGLSDIFTTEDGFKTSKQKKAVDSAEQPIKFRSKMIDNIWQTAEKLDNFGSDEMAALKEELLRIQKKIDNNDENELGEISKSLERLKVRVESGVLYETEGDYDVKLKKLQDILHGKKEELTQHERAVLEEELEHFKQRIVKFGNVKTLKKNGSDKSDKDLVQDERYLKKMHDYLVSKIVHGEL